MKSWATPGGEAAERLHLVQLGEVGLLGLRQGLGVLARGFLELQRHPVRDRGGEVAVLGAPAARRARLVADDADHLALAIERDVEHRVDAEGLEVRVAQLVGQRIAARVVGGDGAPLLERAEVGGEVRGAQHRAFRVLVAGAFVEVVAADRAAPVDEEPDADAIDLERAS